ncbi:MAG: ribosomal protein S18-alanine N-acetyltransferase [Ignisphaera sp.]
MHIRQARIEDLDNIYRLETLCFKDPYPKELLYMLLTLYPELFLVIELESNIIGYVAGIVRKDNFGHIISLCIHPTYRRKGLGKQLVAYIEKVFKESFNVCQYRLEVRTSNIEAISLYKKLGYSIINRISNYYPDGEDAYIMIKYVCQHNC